MKKNSFKRFLAVTLAAATALTFAPVSTLGLSGVIEAQASPVTVASSKFNAAEVAPTNIVSKTVATWTPVNGQADTGTVTASTLDSKKYYAIKIAADAENSATLGIDKTGDAVSVITPDTFDADGISKNSDGTYTVKKGANTYVVFQVAKQGTSKIELTYNKTDASISDATLTIDFTVSGTISSAPTKLQDSSSKDVTEAVIAKNDDSNDFNALFDSTKEKNDNTYYVESSDKTIATVTTNGTDAYGKLSSSKAAMTIVPVKVGKTSVKIYATDGTGEAKAGSALATYDVIVTNPTAATKATAKNIDTTAGKDVTVDITFTGASDYDSYTLEDASGLTASTPYIVGGKSKAKITVPANATTGDHVFTIKNGASTEIGKFTLTVAKAQLSVTPADLVAGGDKKTFTVTTPDAADHFAVVITNEAGTDVTTSFVIYDGSTVATDYNNITADNNTKDIDVKALSTVKAGTYTVTVYNLEDDGSGNADITKAKKVSATFKVTASGDVNPQPEDETNVFTYGGVLNSIYAYKGASYDLVEHAAIKYGSVNYSGSELEWYLVDASNAPAYGEARQDLKSINLSSDAGTVENGKAGSLKVTVSDSDKFITAVNGNTKVVAEALVNGVRTVVYVGAPFKAYAVSENVVKSVINVSVNVQASGVKPEEKDVLDVKIANPTKDNIYLKASEVAYPVKTPNFVETDAHYALTPVLATGDNNPFKGSKLTLTNGDKLPTGTYYETEYIPFKVNGNATDTDTLYLLKVNTTVSVNTGVNFRVKDGESILATTFANDKLVTDPTVYLNLTDAKTWNIMDHIQADVKDIKDVTFTFDSDSANADVDKNGVVTAKSVGNANITIKASYKGLESKTTLMVRVNQYGFDTVSVKGEDGTNAKVLSPRDYNNNSVSVVKVERNLVTRQIPYVQIFVTGNETSNVNYTPVVASANGAKLSYEFVEDYASKGLTIDPTTGKITIDYTKCTNNNYTALGVYGVKVVSADTNKSVATTSYYYVVVDFPDKTISGLEDNYTVGTCTSHAHTDDPAVALAAESAGTAESFDWVYKNTEDFIGDSHYKDDDISAFTTDSFAKTGKICKAIVTDKTMHVLAYNAQSITNRTGYTAKLITVKSAPAVENYVDKIVNKETGEVLYDHSVNATDTARALTIDKVTTIQVSLKYPVASVASGSAVHLSIGEVKNNGHIYNQQPFVTGVVNSKEVDVALYPNSKGTTVITVSPAGHLTATDRTDIHKSPVNVAVTYTGEAANGAKNPAQVKGVKVSNKKGAKVAVSFNKVTTNSTMRYYVQKKVGKKVSGKSIGSTKTTLSVKKGATVKVRVKAYYYDANGVKHVGKYSSWKTLKTDKK